MIPVDSPEDLGEALRLIRKLAGHTQTHVGFHLGTTAQRIGDYEHAKLNPSAKTLLRLLAVVGYRLAIVPLGESGPETALSGPVAAEPPSAGVHGRPEGQETAHGAPEAICGHCGEPQRGYASLWGIPLCHPDEGLDCYRLVTVYGHGAPCLTQPCYDPHPTQEAR